MLYDTSLTVSLVVLPECFQVIFYCRVVLAAADLQWLRIDRPTSHTPAREGRAPLQK